MRRSPRRNTPAGAVVDFLDTYARVEEDLDGFTRSYVNNVWVDDNTKREIRRYRSGAVRSLRPQTLNRLLSNFNLEDAWQARP